MTSEVGTAVDTSGLVGKAFKIVEQAVAESRRDNCTAIVVELT